MQRRNTRQRQLILDCVQARCDHPTAEQIYQDVAAQDERISRGTVYRNLSVLAQNGDITQVDTSAADRFDLRQDRHHHIQCVECGIVVDAPVEYQEALDKLAEGDTGFVITGHHTIFEGLCPKCAKKANQ